MINELTANIHHNIRQHLADPTSYQMQQLADWTDEGYIPIPNLKEEFKNLLYPIDKPLFRGIALPETTLIKKGDELNGHLSFSTDESCAKSFAESSYDRFCSNLFDEPYKKYILVLEQNSSIIPVYPYLFEIDTILYNQYSFEFECINPFNLIVKKINNFYEYSYIHVTQIP